MVIYFPIISRVQFLFDVILNSKMGTFYLLGVDISLTVCKYK